MEQMSRTDEQPAAGSLSWLAFTSSAVLATITTWVWFILHMVHTGQLEQNRPLDGTSAAYSGWIGWASVVLWAVTGAIGVASLVMRSRTAPQAAPSSEQDAQRVPCNA